MCVAALGREAGKCMTGIGSCLGRKNFSSWQFSWHFWDTKAYGTNQKKRHALPPLFQHGYVKQNFREFLPQLPLKNQNPINTPCPRLLGKLRQDSKTLSAESCQKIKVFFIYSHSCFPLESCETPATFKKNQTTEMGAISAPAPKTVGRRQPQYLHMSGSTDSSEWTHWTRAGELEFHGVQP